MHSSFKKIKDKSKKALESVKQKGESMFKEVESLAKSVANRNKLNIIQVDVQDVADKQENKKERFFRLFLFGRDAAIETEIKKLDLVKDRYIITNKDLYFIADKKQDLKKPNAFNKYLDLVKKLTIKEQNEIKQRDKFIEKQKLDWLNKFDKIPSNNVGLKNFKPLLLENPLHTKPVYNYFSYQWDVEYVDDNLPRVINIADVIDKNIELLQILNTNVRSMCNNKPFINQNIDSVEFYKTILEIYDIAQNEPTYNNMENLHCSIYKIMKENIENIYNLEEVYVLKPNINNFFDPIYKLNQGGNGIVYKVGFKNLLDMYFILKIPLNNIDPLHEMVVGLVLNQIRNKTPCFNYCLGGFYCDAEDVKNGNYLTSKNIEICNRNIADNSDTYTFSLWEYIEAPYKKTNNQGLDSLHKFILYNSYFNEKQFIIFIYFLIKSLNDAHVHCSFMHNDLHVNNVRMRKLNTELIKQLPNKGLLGWLKQTTVINIKFLPIILDYGRSTIEFNGNKICSFDPNVPDMFNKSKIGKGTCDYFNPFLDIIYYYFTLLVKLAQTSYIGGNPDTFEEIYHIMFDFFLNIMNTQDKEYLENYIIDIISQRKNWSDVWEDVYEKHIDFWDKFYKISNKDLSDYIDYLENNFFTKI